MPALPKVDPYKNKNQFLAAMGDEVFRNLRPHMEMVPFEVGKVLHLHGDAVQFIYFPLNACISIVTTVQEGRGVEVALIGSEGFVGLRAALGSKANWHQAIVQIPGDCLKIKVDVFLAELKRSNSLLDHVHRYTRYLMAEISQTAACNRLHRLEQRLARWLLMTHDHVKTDEFVETHEFLSYMLGSDRSEVTLAAGILRKSGLISYARGKVRILDREGLEKICCDCYRIYANEALRLSQNEI
jgi:CRP-like cAMP-binding protein